MERFLISLDPGVEIHWILEYVVGCSTNLNAAEAEEDGSDNRFTPGSSVFLPLYPLVWKSATFLTAEAIFW